jgi:hypothetical protein
MIGQSASGASDSGPSRLNDREQSRSQKPGRQYTNNEAMTVATAMRMIFRTMAFMQFLTVWTIVVTTAQSHELLNFGRLLVTYLSRRGYGSRCLRPIQEQYGSTRH